MELHVVEKSFPQKDGSIFKYNALVVNGSLEGRKFEVVLDTYETGTKLIKKSLINNVQNGTKYDVFVSKKISNGNVVKRLVTVITGIGEVTFKVKSDNDIFVVDLYEDLTHKK